MIDEAIEQDSSTSDDEATNEKAAQDHSLSGDEPESNLRQHLDFSNMFFGLGHTGEDDREAFSHADSSLQLYMPSQ